MQHKKKEIELKSINLRCEPCSDPLVSYEKKKTKKKCLLLLLSIVFEYSFTCNSYVFLISSMASTSSGFASCLLPLVYLVCRIVVLFEYIFFIFYFCFLYSSCLSFFFIYFHSLVTKKTTIVYRTFNTVECVTHSNR